MGKSQDTHFGFKKITNANWQQFDEITKLWCNFTAAAKTNEGWIKSFSYPTLDPKVPEEIAKLLEVARGAMIYGWYFNPLLTLGNDQCWRVLEAGVRMRCQQFGVPTTEPVKNGKLKGTVRENGFGKNINALIKHGKIPEVDQPRWQAAKGLRDLASHPKQQLVLDPGRAQGDLNSVVDCLNDLFR
jgi:hypothetical protein